MLQLEKIPLLKDAKLIIIDEGVDAIYAHKLIIGWSNIFKETNQDRVFKILSLSNPKQWYMKKPEFRDFEIHDYYTIDVNKGPEDDLQKLESMIDELDNNATNVTIILDNLNALIFQIGLSASMRFMKRLTKKITQLVCIYQRDFIDNRIPQIETLGTTYVRLEKASNRISVQGINYIARTTHRKVEGSIHTQMEVVNQDLDQYALNCKKVLIQSKDRMTVTKEPEKIQSSFRIEINEREMEQREQTPLPYTAVANLSNVSKIIYQPEEDDDIDEDDPDNDLCF